MTVYGNAHRKVLLKVQRPHNVAARIVSKKQNMIEFHQGPYIDMFCFLPFMAAEFCILSYACTSNCCCSFSVSFCYCFHLVYRSQLSCSLAKEPPLQITVRCNSHFVTPMLFSSWLLCLSHVYFGHFSREDCFLRVVSCIHNN